MGLAEAEAKAEAEVEDAGDEDAPDQRRTVPGGKREMHGLVLLRIDGSTACHGEPCQHERGTLPGHLYI
ncbi:hypothetical protein GCM10023334_010550 [Nonomuraea thailandensis]